MEGSMLITRILVAAAIAFAPAPALAQAGAKVLRVVPYADLQSLDPIVTTVGIVQSHATMIYDFLFGRDGEQMPRPQMVESWTTSPDGLVWRFTLRERLAFHDGAPVTAEDVVASLKRWGARDPYGRQAFALTAELVAEDARSLRWSFTRPYGLLLQGLSKSGGPVPAIMPRRIAESDPQRPISEAIGSGPFVFVREAWVAGSKVVYRRNENYVPRAEPASGTAGGKVVRVDRVEWLNIRDPQTAMLALTSGEVDYLENPATDFLPLLRQSGQRILRTNPLGTQGILRMNHLHPPFDDLRARQALLYLVNQEDYLRAMFGSPDIWRSCWAYFVCGGPLESAAGVQQGFGKDRAKAKQLFAEAGYKGEKIVVLHPTDVQFMSVATQILAEELKAIGVNVEMQTLDFASMASRRANRAPPGQGGWHIGMTYWPGLNIADPVGNVPLQASCEKAWPGWPCDGELQAMIDRYPATQGDEARKALASQIQQRAYERVVPYVPIGQWFAPIAHSPKLTGVIGVPGAMVLWNIDKVGN
jgi:peptide/nickel transport system substrate-binding protein